MRIRTILAAAAAPAALTAILLGTAGQASAATNAPTVSAYFYNPSGNALGGPAGGCPAAMSSSATPTWPRSPRR